MVSSSEQSKRILPLKDRRILMEDCLKRAGADVIGPVGRLDSALNKAEEAGIDAALLDVDLNGERCWPAADALMSRGVPFAFATGFATNIVMPERFTACPVLSKPYRERDVLALLVKMLSQKQQERQVA